MENLNMVNSVLMMYICDGEEFDSASIIDTKVIRIDTSENLRNTINEIYHAKTMLFPNKVNDHMFKYDILAIDKFVKNDEEYEYIICRYNAPYNINIYKSVYLEILSPEKVYVNI